MKVIISKENATVRNSYTLFHAREILMKLILTSILSLLSISLFSLDTETLLQYSTPLNPSQGLLFSIDNNQSINDFSNIPKDIPVYKAGYSIDNEAIIPFSPIQNHWYAQDFSTSPFDGQLEILVMGEPTPPVTISLLIASLLSIAFLQYNKYRVYPSLKSLYPHENES